MLVRGLFRPSLVLSLAFTLVQVMPAAGQQKKTGCSKPPEFFPPPQQSKEEKQKQPKTKVQGKEPKYLPPLATGRAPECSDHVGVRNYKSGTAKTTDTAIYATGVARRDESGCQRSAELHIEHENATHSY